MILHNIVFILGLSVPFVRFHKSENIFIPHSKSFIGFGGGMRIDISMQPKRIEVFPYFLATFFII